MRVIEDLSGQLIGGRYRARELIGVGGMDSAVWKAWQIGAERAVAIKVLPPADDAAGKRFARGARIAANLSHPNCLVIHDYGKTEDGKLYLAMELLVGQVLQDVLPAEGMGVADVLHIVDQVLQALEHAHAQRAVHRDLKPDNLFLCRKNDDPMHVKILDFGIAKYIEEDPGDPSDEERGKDDFEDLVTEQRQVCGTPQYMAPEQVVGARVDGRADLYALGCVMYRMLTGRLPFDGKTRYELYQKHLQEAPRPFSEVRPDLEFPPRLELIVMKALAKRPDQRFQTAAEMRHALQTVDAEARSRRGARARVALKHTSPQQQSAAPWTLSQPSPFMEDAPLPQNESAANWDTEDGTDPTILPATIFGVQGQTAPPIPGPTASGPPPLLPGRTTPDARGVLSRPASGRVAAPTTEVSRPAKASLNDAVLRHPASRVTAQGPVTVAPTGGTTGAGPMGQGGHGARVSGQTAGASRLSQMSPMVPRSTETEPSSVADRDEPPRRRWAMFAVMGGAFLLGVGGVALAMSLSQGGTDSGEEVARGAQAPVEAATNKPTGGDHAQGASGQAAGHEPGREPGTPTTPQPTAVERAAAVGRAGSVAGEALAGAPLEVADAPATPVEVALDSEPSGATVKDAGQALGTTPGKFALVAGKHSLTFERTGYKTTVLELDVTPADASAPTRKVALVADKSAARQGTTPVIKPHEDPEKPLITKPLEPGTRELIGSKPAVVELVPKKVDPKANEKPAVTDPNKKPVVKLLDDDSEPAPPKPKVKVLDDP